MSRTNRWRGYSPRPWNASTDGSYPMRNSGDWPMFQHYGKDELIWLTSLPPKQLLVQDSRPGFRPRAASRVKEPYHETFARCDCPRNSSIHYVQRRLNRKMGKSYGEGNRKYRDTEKDGITLWAKMEWRLDFDLNTDFEYWRTNYKIVLEMHLCRSRREMKDNGK